ncbi:unnamed protein product [Closterium sp. NIES-54]
MTGCLVSAVGDILGWVTYTGRVLSTDLRPYSATLMSTTMETVALRAIVSAATSTPARWHARLAHVGVDTITSSARHEVTTDLKIKPSAGTDAPCVSCIGGKLARHTFPDKGSDADDALAVVHIDLCGPFGVASKDGSLYFLLLKDCKTHYVWVRPVAKKSDVLGEFEKWLLVGHPADEDAEDVLLPPPSSALPAPPRVANLPVLPPASASGDEGSIGALPVAPAKSIASGQRDVKQVGVEVAPPTTGEQRMQGNQLNLLKLALNNELVGTGWKKSQVDEASYFKVGNDGVACWVLYYVDDLLAASISTAMLKELLEAAFELREILPVEKYHGLQFVHERPARNLWMHQQNYFDKLRMRFIDKEQIGRTPKTPISVDDEETQEREEEEYRQKHMVKRGKFTLNYIRVYKFLDYAASPVAESESLCPPSVGGECALGMDVLEDRHENFECLAAAVPHLVAMLLAPEGDPDALDIPTPRSYAEAITVYGLRQAPRDWHNTLRTTRAALGFAPSTADPLRFLRTKTSLPPFYILVYVDDLVFATSDTKALALVKSELQKRNTYTDLGELRSYLGLQITRDRARRTITLTQSHMVHQVIQRFSFRYSSPQSTPLPTGHSLSVPPSDESVEMNGPLGSGSDSWRSTRSSSVLSSSCEAEIYAGAMAAQELCWLTYLLTDLGERRRSSPVLYVDNKAMIALCQEHRLEHRMKHIALRDFLARELRQRGQLHLAYVATRANTPDIFIKARSPPLQPTSRPCDPLATCSRPAMPPLPPARRLLMARSPPLLPTHRLLMARSPPLPSFSTNLVSITALHDAMVTTITPGGQRVSICTCTRTGRHLATFTRLPGSSLYTLATEPPQVAASAQVSASDPVPPPCSCHLLWHHRLSCGTTDLVTPSCHAFVACTPVSLSLVFPVMEVARTSMIHAVAPLSLWSFAVLYAAHQLNLWPRVSLAGTSPTERWMGKVGDASDFRFYHPTSRRILPSKDVTFDKSAPFHHLVPYRSAPLPPPPLFLAPGHPPVDPLPPQGPTPSSVSQVDPLLGIVSVEVAVDSGAARGAASKGAEPVGAEPGGAESEGARSGGAQPRGAEPKGAEPEGAESGGAESENAEPTGAEPRGTASSGGPAGASPRLSPRPEPISP